jgi:hypothetical protein
MTEYQTHVEVHFTGRDGLEFTDSDYQFFGDGDIERGKRNLEAAIKRLSDQIDMLVLAEMYAGTNKALGGIGG